jgi:hypothetical protein
MAVRFAAVVLIAIYTLLIFFNISNLAEAYGSGSPYYSCTTVSR